MYQVQWLDGNIHGCMYCPGQNEVCSITMVCPLFLELVFAVIDIFYINTVLFAISHVFALTMKFNTVTEGSCGIYCAPWRSGTSNLFLKSILLRHRTRPSVWKRESQLVIFVPGQHQAFLVTDFAILMEQSAGVCEIQRLSCHSRNSSQSPI